MIEDVADVAPETFARYDAIIDVRSPAEFAEDHVPGAVNLPVLNDAERAEVGTIYTRDSRFTARRLGAALIARNVARHLETALADREPKFRPLIYCWRGGMRSHAMATILSQIGWRVGVVNGGYRTWRRTVVTALYDDETPLNLVLIDGQTGTAKTEILRRLASPGAQTIDLEALAAHKGSVFGEDVAQPQPTQKFFESLLFERLRRLDPSAPIAVEAESARIGKLALPKRLWTAMRAAPRIVLEAAPEARARFLVAAYREMIASPDKIRAAVEKLKPFHSKEKIESWLSLAAAHAHAALAEQLMREHYDPLYDRSRKRSPAPPAAVLRLDGFDDENLNRAAGEIAAIMKRLAKRSPP